MHMGLPVTGMDSEKIDPNWKPFKWILNKQRGSACILALCKANNSLPLNFFACSKIIRRAHKRLLSAVAVCTPCIKRSFESEQRV